MPTFGLTQWNKIPFQETCDFIYTDRKGTTFFSSVNGWYEFSGQSEPVKLNLNGLDNKNIQSNMHEGRNHALWFSTYNRIIRFDQQHQQITQFTLTSPSGDTLNSDYYVFRIDTTPNQVWVKQANKIYVFDTEKNTSVPIADSITGRRVIQATLHGKMAFLTYYYTFTPNIVLFDEKTLGGYQRYSWVNWPSQCLANDMSMIDSHTVLIAASKGLYIGDIATRKVRDIFNDRAANGVACLQQTGPTTWLVSFDKDGLNWLDWNSHTLTFSIRPFEDELEDSSIQRISRDQNGTLFLVAYEKNIYFGNLLKRKFFNFNTLKEPIINTSLLRGSQFRQLTESTEISSNGIPYLVTPYFEMSSPPPYKYSLYSSTSHKLKRIPHLESSLFYRYFTDEAFNIYASFLGKGLYQWQEANQEWMTVEYPGIMDTMFNSFYALRSGICIASLNQERLVLWNRFHPDSFVVNKPFSGDIYSYLHDDVSEIIYTGTDQGIMRIDSATLEPQILEATKNIPCYCALKDDHDNLWFSSSEGLFSFSLRSNQLKQYDHTDGASTIPYWPRKCTSITSDSLVFYYPGGFTLITPSSIVSLKNECKLLFSNFKVNDVLHTTPSYLNFTDYFSTSYALNEIEFDIQAVDLSDPAGPRIQYILEGYDRNWEVSEGPITRIRYPNLPPGHYTLKVKGSNADGKWNEIERRISIHVAPPFWMTWWFITMSVLSIGGIIYGAVRSYFKLKLERKNQLLREQALIIEKQQAVEHERTRIASEMHDDLGSGLTTIRYLSDKALLQAKDTTEADQIQRIADHSNRLVRNMSEIIWAMNSRFDNAENLIGYLRRYASEYLEERQMPLSFSAADEGMEQLTVTGEKRRNVFLVFKELLHNAVKYSDAQRIDIDISIKEAITITITEVEGRGFDPEGSIEKGNGLYNCRKRIQAIGGLLIFNKTPDAMRSEIILPLPSVTHA